MFAGATTKRNVRPADPASATDGAPLERAAFLISIDFEMAWGLSHRPNRQYSYPAERSDLARLVALFDKYQIRATWATVGHLMLDGCSPVDGVKHPEIIRPVYTWLDGDWFDGDPCSDRIRDPDRYAPDVISLVKNAAADHEIATHGFSHVMAGEAGCSRECFDSELRAAAAAAARHGIELRSIIFPRNSIGHVDLLAKHGLVSYRGHAMRHHANPWQKVIDRTIGSERTAVRPRADGELWNLPAALMFDVDSRYRTWRLWMKQVERRLDQAVRRRSMFHIWLHPHNLRDRPEVAFRAMERLCRAAARHRDAGRLETVTMGGLAATLSTPLSVTE